MNPPYQMREVVVDGLNLGDKIFNFKNRLFFAQPKEAHENISNAFVFLDRPLVQGMGGQAWESEENQQNAEDMEDVLKVVGTFLGCFSLVNPDRNLEIVFRSSMASTLYKPEEIEPWLKTGGGIHSHINTRKRQISEKESLKFLNETTPLFEKVSTILDKSKKKKINPLQVALLVYHQSLQKHDILNDFLGLVTVIESLLCNIEDLRFKFAQRATLIYESDPLKRKYMFDRLSEIYGMRNNLVHGTVTSMYPYVTYLKAIQELEPIVKKILLQYIELAYEGKDKQAIMDHIDDKALGIT